MRRLETTLLAIAVSCCLPLAAVAAATVLSPQQIKATFGTGAPFRSTSPAGVVNTLVLKADGTASRAPKGSTAATTGTWRLSDTGYCSKWGKNAENCYTIQVNANKYAVLDAKGKLAANWTPAATAAPAKP